MTTIVHEYDVEYSDDCGHHWSPASLDFIEHNVKFEMLIESAPNEKLLIATSYLRHNRFVVLRNLQKQHQFALAQYVVKIICYKGHRVLRLKNYLLRSTLASSLLQRANDSSLDDQSIFQQSSTIEDGSLQDAHMTEYGASFTYSVPLPKHTHTYENLSHAEHEEVMNPDFGISLSLSEELHHSSLPYQIPLPHEELFIEGSILSRIPLHSNTRFGLMEETQGPENP